MMTSLQVTDRVGNSIVGLGSVSPRMNPVEVGKCAPCIRTGEDVEGLLRCDFLDPTIPTEFNLINSVAILKKLQKNLNLMAFSEGVLNPLDLIANRPSIGFVPPECLSDPSDYGAKALERTGEIGKKISSLRVKNPDGKFWAAVAKEKLYPRWIRELLFRLKTLKGDAIPSPTPVINKEIKSSVDLQIEVNRSVAMSWKRIAGRRHREIGLLYSLHLAPNALDSPDLLRQAVLGLGESLEFGENFLGVHISFTNMRTASSKASRIETAKHFAREVSSTAGKYSLFTIVSDVGPVGPVFLDESVSFATYYPGMTPRKVFDSFGVVNKDLKFGKVLGLWKYNLHDRNDVRRRKDTMDDTGLYTNTVPLEARGPTSHREYRILFGKPYNVSVMERLNMERSKELKQKKNSNPGQSHIGRSSDPLIAPWA